MSVLEQVAPAVRRRGAFTAPAPGAPSRRLAQVAARPAAATWAVRGLRALLAVPFVLMAPETGSAVLGRPDAVAHLSASTADVLGTSALLLLVTMLAVTPVHTMTGWRWHLVLRRDCGVAMFAVAATDLGLAATTTGDTFPGGVLARVGGHTFLVAGTLATLLLLPLAATANRRAQRWMGGSWKSLHRLTYAVWGVVLLHLLLLFGLGGVFLDALAVSGPLAVMRIPAVRRRWVAARRSGTRRGLRTAMALVLVASFAVGYGQLVHELAVKGAAAFVQRPPDG